MFLRKILIGCGLILTALGCQTVGAEHDQLARITNVSEASRAALQQTINEILKVEVLLADDALTRTSVLTIELNPPGTLQNPNPLGRDMGKPIQFRLVTNQSECILIDQRDGTRHVLNDTTCVSE